jgi:hypothetical protein
MGSNTDRTLCRLGRIRMMVGSKRKRRPECQQYAEPRDAFREQPHISYTLPD